MKRIKITSNCLAPGAAEGEMVTFYAGTVVDIDDHVAGQIVAGGRAAYVAKADGKYVEGVKDTAPKADKADKAKE